jgi:hypothetical protein
VRAVIILEGPQSPETEKTPAIVFFEEKKGALPENLSPVEEPSPDLTHLEPILKQNSRDESRS